MTYQMMQPYQRNACVEVAARAFSDYDYFRNYIPDDKRRDRFLHRLLEVELKIHQGIAETWVAMEGDRIAGVAMLCSDTYRQPSDPQYIRAGFLKVFWAGGIRDVNRWLKVEHQVGVPCHRVKAWYLSMLTVDPDFQRQGVGSRMLEECILPRAREMGGKDITLFTNSQENRQFYQKNGFTEFDAMEFTYRGKWLGSWSYQRAL